MGGCLWLDTRTRLPIQLQYLVHPLARSVRDGRITTPSRSAWRHCVAFVDKTNPGDSHTDMVTSSSTPSAYSEVSTGLRANSGKSFPFVVADRAASRCSPARSADRFDWPLARLRLKIFMMIPRRSQNAA
jgi:hypothetical protein